MGRKVMGDFDFKHNNPNMNGNMNGTMGNDIVDFFKNIATKTITSAQASTTSAPAPVATAKATDDKMMTYLKYGAMAVGGVALVIFIMKKMKKA